MALKIEWSNKAENSFDEILVQLEGRWGEKVTRNFVKKVYGFLDLLTEFPEIGSIQNQAKKIRGFTIIKQVNLFYRIKDDSIILLKFFDNRQNPKKKIS